MFFKRKPSKHTPPKARLAMNINHKKIFSARQNTASDDILSLKAKFEAMQKLRPDCHADVQSLIDQLERVHKELNQLGATTEKAV